MALGIKELKKLASKRSVLYVATAIAAVQFVGYIGAAHTTSAEMMVVAGLAARTATANMTLVLAAAVVAGLLTTIIGAHRATVKEGMDDKANDDSGEPVNNKTKKKQGKKGDIVVEASSIHEAIAKAAAEKGCKRGKDGKCMTPIDENEERVPKVDVNATLAANAKEATTAAGHNGTVHMKKETEAIINQQQKLLEAMNQMGPMMEKAHTLLNKVSGMGLDFGTNGLSNAIAGLSKTGAAAQ